MLVCVKWRGYRSRSLRKFARVHKKLKVYKYVVVLIEETTIVTDRNPFNITFGKEPNELISRKTELEEIYNSLSFGEANNEVFIISGVRGCGKTVAMTTVSGFYKKQERWLVIDLNPEYDLLEQLASKIIDEGKLKKLFLKTEFNFSFKGFGFSLNGDVPINNVSSLLKRNLNTSRKSPLKY